MNKPLHNGAGTLVRPSFLLTTLVLFTLTFFTGPLKMYGQCNSPSSWPSLNCEEAPLICLEGSCFETNTEPLFCCNGWCGANTAIHNPQYFSFIAAQENVEIQIHVDYCDNGVALQSAILDACPWDNSNVIACDPGTSPGGTMVLSANGLIPDQWYWIVIDGSIGATCGYTFTSTEGIWEEFTLGDLAADSTFAGETAVCPGYDDLYLETGPIDGIAQGYFWVTGWSQDTFTSTLPNTTIDIPTDAPEGAWEICVTAFNGCDTSNTICIPISISGFATVFKGPDTFCPEYFPFIWGNEIIIGPGSYEQTFTTPDGCAFDTIWIVESYPEPEIGHIDTIVCETVFLYEGTPYFESGMYTLFYPGGDVNGCDSMAELELVLRNIGLYIEAACIENEVFLVSQITNQPHTVDTVIYSWYTCSLDSLLSDAPVYRPDTSGCYCLVVASAYCTDTICSTFDAESCPQSCELVPDFVCNGAEINFNYPGIVEGNENINWHIVAPDQSDVFIMDQDSFHLSFTEAGLYLVSATHQSDTGTLTCYDAFLVEDYTEVGICCDSIICDSCTYVALYSTNAPVTLHLDVGGGAFILDGLLQWDYEVCLPPLNEITLTIISAVHTGSGCPAVISENNSATIFRAPPLHAEILPAGDLLCALPEGMTGYAWRSCAGGNVIDFSRCFTPDSSGCYCVSIISPEGCRDTACYDFIIDDIDPVSHDSGVRINPNPSEGIWNVSSPSEPSFPVYWSLMDVHGRLVEKGVFNETHGRIQVAPSYSAGVYLLKLDSAGGWSIIHKLVLQ